MESVSNWDTPIVRIFILIENDNLDNFNSFISKNYILDDTVRSGDEIRSKEGIWLFEKQYTHTRSKIKLNKYSEHNAWTMWYVECQTLFQPIQNMIELEGKQVKRPIQNLWINEWV